MNFIYGERDQNLFVPIDGQQRLTSLFLVHWYVFKQANYQQGLDTLSKFSYKTRNSSQRFCKRLLQVSIDFSKNILSEQIENAFWYSGHFTNDPTIRSMLVVIDEIHHQFKDIPDFAPVMQTLISDNCPMTFLWLPMDNFQKRDDLYIKMNARGKLLTDFEIFKAKLQSSDLLNRVLGGTATKAQRLEFISKFNNEYAELFYHFYKSTFDEAMMSFVQAIVRDEYFSQACEYGVTQSEYRSLYKAPLGMNGNVFFNFMEFGGYDFPKFNSSHGNAAFEKSIKKIDALLKMFSACGDNLGTIPVLLERHYHDLDLFKTSYKDGTDADNFAKFALYEYLYKFGIPNSSDSNTAYSMWKRFVYNIISNTNVAGHVEYICDTMIAIKQIVSNIFEATEASVLNGISSYNMQTHISGIKYQLSEEKQKASLMLTDPKWRESILETEAYYYDGQIGFLLEYSARKSGHADIDEFKRGFSISQKIFDSEKLIKSTCDDILFEQALLTMQDDTVNHTAHLIKQSNSASSWGFCRKDYNRLLDNAIDSKKINIVFELFDLLLGNQDINTELKAIISSVPPERFDGGSMWKRFFVENQLFDADMQYSGHYWRFNNCINLNKCNNEVLMLMGTTVRSYSMELKTYLLYHDLIGKGIPKNDMLLHLDTTSDIIENGFSRRYIEWNHMKIAFTGDKLDSEAYSVMNSDGKVVQIDYTGILNLFGL